MGIKMVLSGEGADEIFGGYLYFHLRADARDVPRGDSCASSTGCTSYDCLRANKSMAAWGVEARVPFLDRDFLDVAMRIDAAAKRPFDGRIEKHLLREAVRRSAPGRDRCGARRNSSPTASATAGSTR